MTNSTKELDPLYSTLGGDPDLATLVELFVEELPNRVQTMRECLQIADLEGLQQAAHQLKGAAGSYGFHQITAEAAEVERTVREGRGEQTCLHGGIVGRDLRPRPSRNSAALNVEISCLA